MFKPNTWYYIIKLIISSAIFCFFCFYVLGKNPISINNDFDSNMKLDLQSELQISKDEEIILNSKENSTSLNDDEVNEITEEESAWYVEIPKINLKAKIQEGTSKEVMDDYVGHFEETSKCNGNVGLAAHNRGYKKNYFGDIKKLKEDDNIFYCYKGQIKEYAVINNFIINDTDWAVFEEKDNNIITLITCVENEPNYRRCVQAVEITKEY